MTVFESKFFIKFKFTREQIQRYFDNAKRDMKIATDDPYLEVKFNYCYNALIKMGIAAIALKGGVKVRSVMGHHVKVIEKLADILDDESVMSIGNAMRMKRNEDFYGGGVFVSEKESKEYIEYVEGILKRIEVLLSNV